MKITYLYNEKKCSFRQIIPPQKGDFVDILDMHDNHEGRIQGIVRSVTWVITGDVSAVVELHERKIK